MVNQHMVYITDIMVKESVKVRQSIGVDIGLLEFIEVDTGLSASAVSKEVVLYNQG